MSDRYQKLLEENRYLKALLKSKGIFYIAQGEALGKEEKIKVYMDYFHGNDSVYATKYYSKKRNIYGWNPSCKNTMTQCCPHSHFQSQKCTTCKYFLKLPLTEATVEQHMGDLKFEGLGLYPLQDDNTCYFVAIDFDENDWFEEMLCVYRIAKEKDIDCVMEKSSSGEGGHLWFFFAKAIQASLVRNFAMKLLKEAMNRNRNISFNSFDRLFPNQDFIPKNGLGNLIAAPYSRKRVIENNTTIFIDEGARRITKPIDYLASIRKITLEELQSIVKEKDDYFFENDDTKLDLGNNTKYSSEITCVEEAMLKIDKTNLNAATLNVLRRCASVMNPEYITKLKMRLPIYKTQRVLHWYEEGDRYIYIPRGRLEFLKEKMPDTKWNYSNACSDGKTIEVNFKGTIREEQQEAIERLTRENLGILQADTGWGKTVAGLYMIASLKVNTLIIVSSTAIQSQWLNKIKTFLDYEDVEKNKDSFVGRIDGKKKVPLGNIDVAIDKSLSKYVNLKELLSQYGMIIVDECQHIGSVTFDTILRNAPVKRVYGLSATPKRTDELTSVIKMYCGPIKAIGKTKKDNSIKKVLVPRYTNTRILEKNYSNAEMLKRLSADKARNYLIFKDITSEYNEGRQIIVLTERMDHLKLLEEMLEKSLNNVFVIHGKVTNKKREEAIAKMTDLQNDSFVLLATSKSVGEGFDLPSLNTLFQVLPISADTRVNQHSGRIERAYENKGLIKVYDYVDEAIPMAKSMYYKRLKEYEKKGYYIEEMEVEEKLERVLFDHKKFKTKILNDFNSAKNEIIIFSSNPIFEEFNKYYDSLLKAHEKGIHIHFVVKKDTDEKVLKYMQGLGGNVVYSNNMKKMIVIDRNIVWNCSVDIFRNQTNESYFTRYCSVKLSDEILSEIKDVKEEIKEGLFLLEENG